MARVSRPSGLAKRLGAAALLAAGLAGCNAIPAGMGVRAGQPPPPRIGADTPPSAASAALTAYYAGLQSGLLSRGLLRTDSGATDAPYSARMLANTFIRVALYDEFDTSSGKLVARATESRLRRWEAPVRLGLSFGASIPEDRRGIERARVASLLARLSRITGHPISLASTGVNFHLYIVNEEERQALGPEISAALPGISGAEIAAFTRMPSSTYCQVSAMVDNASSLYQRAFAVVRAEHPDLMHLSCLHEEIAQGLGLPNDSPSARPSIFNDDQEFALLTPMDENMLRILYDARLKPGMRIPQAAPIVAEIAEELLGGGS